MVKITNCKPASITRKFNKYIYHWPTNFFRDINYNFTPICRIITSILQRTDKLNTHPNNKLFSTKLSWH